jgi:hypothetical protein
MPEVPDCALTRHLQAIRDRCRAIPDATIAERVAYHEAEAALGLLAHAWIARNTTGKGMLVVPLAEEPHLYATEDDDGRPLMGDLGD